MSIADTFATQRSRPSLRFARMLALSLTGAAACVAPATQAPATSPTPPAPDSAAPPTSEQVAGAEQGSEAASTASPTSPASDPEAEPASEPVAADAQESGASSAELQPTAEPLPAAEPEPSHAIHGSTTTRIVARKSDDAHDLDLRQSVVLDFGDPKTSRVTGHLYGILTADLDGGSLQDQFAFPSLADTFDGAVDAWLYHAYVDIERTDGLDLLRIGRQIDYETPEFAFFDGVALSTEEQGSKRARFGVYGGIPVHLYESSRSGDMLFGLFGECVPWKQGRARVDWMHLEDETRLAAHQNDLIGLSLWQRAGEKLRLDGHFTNLEGDARDFDLGANWDDPERDFVVRATWHSLLSTQKDFVVELDPYYGSLQSLFPYNQIGLSLEKGIGERATVRGGFDLRRVDDGSDIGTFNRDYDRAFVGTTVHDAFTKGLDLDLDADTWDADGRSVNGWGVSLARDFESGYEASLGTYYSLYKFDLNSSTERDDVRTWFVKVERQWSKSWRGEIGYDFEDADFDTFHTLRVGVTWNF